MEHVAELHGLRGGVWSHLDVFRCRCCKAERSRPIGEEPPALGVAA